MATACTTPDEIATLCKHYGSETITQIIMLWENGKLIAWKAVLPQREDPTANPVGITQFADFKSCDADSALRPLSDDQGIVIPLSVDDVPIISEAFICRTTHALTAVYIPRGSTWACVRRTQAQGDISHAAYQARKRQQRDSTED